MSQFTARLNRLLFPSYRVKSIERKLDQLTEARRLRPRVVPGPDSTALWQAYTGLVRPLAPVQVARFPKKRFGSNSDGAYVMLDDLAGITAAFSLGIGQEISWDHEMANRGIPVFQFDYSVRNLPFNHPLFHFFPLKIGRTDDGQGTAALETLVRRHAPGAGDLLLKMDIEGAEWEVFDGLDPAVLKRFRQIVCEFHGFSRVRDRDWLERATRVFAKLTHSHRMIHVHANNTEPPLLADNVFISDILEMSFVRAADYESSETFEAFPGELDRPCDQERPDIPLGTFRY